MLILHALFQGQGMISFIHIAKNVNAAELGWFQDVILDACCQNIASSDEIWELVVEMSVLIVTCTQQSNPRSPWYSCLSLCFMFITLFTFCGCCFKLKERYGGL